MFSFLHIVTTIHLRSFVLRVFLFISILVIPGTFVYADITVSGTLYSDEGSTEITSGKTIKMAVGTSTTGVFSTTTDSSAGTFTFTLPTGHGVTNATPLTVFVDGDATNKAVTLTVASSTNSISNLDIYKHRLIVRHESTSTSVSVTNDILAFYDSSDDSDIPYTAYSVTDTLTVHYGTELHIWTGKAFAPGGTVTVSGNEGTSPDGDMHLDDNSTYYQAATTTLAGSLTVDSSATVSNTGTFVFNANITGKTLSGDLTTLGNVTFDGVGGGWTFSNNASTTDLTITNGTVVAPSLLTVEGDYANDGTFTHSSGKIFFAPEGWDMTTTTFDGVPFSVASEDVAPQGLAFKPDGTKVFVIGGEGDDINPYTLSTPWDVTTAHL